MKYTLMGTTASGVSVIAAQGELTNIRDYVERVERSQRPATQSIGLRHEIAGLVAGSVATRQARQAEKIVTYSQMYGMGPDLLRRDVASFDSFPENPRSWSMGFLGKAFAFGGPADPRGQGPKTPMAIEWVRGWLARQVGISPQASFGNPWFLAQFGRWIIRGIGGGTCGRAAEDWALRLERALINHETLGLMKAHEDMRAKAHKAQDVAERLGAAILPHYGPKRAQEYLSRWADAPPFNEYPALQQLFRDLGPKPKATVEPKAPPATWHPFLGLRVEPVSAAKEIEDKLAAEVLGAMGVDPKVARRAVDSLALFQFAAFHASWNPKGVLNMEPRFETQHHCLWTTARRVIMDEAAFPQETLREASGRAHAALRILGSRSVPKKVLGELARHLIGGFAWARAQKNYPSGPTEGQYKAANTRLQELAKS